MASPQDGSLHKNARRIRLYCLICNVVCLFRGSSTKWWNPIVFVNFPIMQHSPCKTDRAAPTVSHRDLKLWELVVLTTPTASPSICFVTKDIMRSQ